MREYIKRPAQRIAAFFLAIFLTLGAMPAATAEGAAPNDLSGKIGNIHVNMTLKKGDGTLVPIIVDNQKDENFTGSLEPGCTIVFDISWEIAEDDFYGKVNEGDYFDIDLPADYFTFRDTTLNTPLVFENETLGYWGVKDNKIHFALSQTGAEKRYIKGYFSAYGTLREDKDDDVDIEIGDVDLPPIPVKPATPNPGGDYPYEGKEPLKAPPIVKDGMSYPGSEYIDWVVWANYDNMVTAAVHSHPAITPLKNAMIEDTLEFDQTIEEIDINSVIPRPKNADGVLTDEWGANINVRLQFEELEQNPGETLEAFRARIKNYNGPAYGISSDKKSLIIHLGDVPGNGVKLAKNDTELRAKLKAENNGLTDAELDTMVRSWGSQGIAKGEAVGYQIYIKAHTDRGQKEYHNKAVLSTDDKSFTSNNKSVVLEDLAGGIESGEPYSVRLEKRDAENGNVLKDASFQLEIEKNGQFIPYTPLDGGPQTRTTDQSGVVEFKKLGSGTYRFVETAAAPGYDKDSVTFSPETFTINNDDTEGVVVTATNALLKGKVELTKVDKDNAQQYLKDAKFQLYQVQAGGSKLYYKAADNDGKAVWTANAAEAKRLTTDTDGKIKVDQLPLGDYAFVETAAPEGYELDSTPITFTLDETNATAGVAVTAENGKVTPPPEEIEDLFGKVELTKVDKEDAQKFLKGAKFQLYQVQADGSKLYYKAADTDGKAVWTANAAEAKSLTTDADGKIKVDQLPLGDYAFVETAAPEGYVLDSTPIAFTLDETNAAAGVAVTAVNKKIIPPTGSVELTKVDAENAQQYLKGAKFQLYQAQADGSKLYYKAADNDGKAIWSTNAAEAKSLITDTDGKIKVDQLPLGDYAFVETAAPEDYVLDSTPIAFTLDETNAAAGVSVTAENGKVTPPPEEIEELFGKVELTKVDKEDAQKFLKGAKFQLYQIQTDGSKLYYKAADSDGKAVWTANAAEAKSLTTDADGKIKVDQLPLGDYAFVETAAPEDYVLDSTPIAFTLDETNATAGMSVTAENGKVETPPTPPTPTPPTPTPPTPTTPETPTPPAPTTSKTVETTGSANPKTGIADVSAAVVLLALLLGGSTGAVALRKRK